MKKRLAAEWEPVKGVMIAWPLFIPHQLVVDFTKFYEVYVSYPSEEEKEKAIRYFTEWGVDLSHVIFCKGEQGFDAPWVRDWGMHAVFDEEKQMMLVGAEYQLSTPFVTYEEPEVMFDAEHNPLSKAICDQAEDRAQAQIAEAMGLPFRKLPYALTGGNIMSDGYNKMMSMHVIRTENRYKGVSDEDFFAKVAEDTGMSEYSIFSNYADFGLQHIDCYLKMLDEETLLVSRAPEDHLLYQRYEDLLEKEVRKARTRYGRPYRIFRIDLAEFNKGSDELTAYVNSIILNNRVFVPMYGIPQDEIALKQWQEAMPGYEIRGYEFEFEKEPAVIENLTGYVRTGWGTEDVLHCRTRAVWDKDMLYMSVRRLETIEQAEKQLDIPVQIVDYSKDGLVEGSPALYYRRNADIQWKKAPLAKTGDEEMYLGTLSGKSGDVISYYVEAESRSGKRERMPRVAPEGCYSVMIQ